jgi:hypothetical protein
MAEGTVVSLPAREWQRVTQLGARRRARELEKQLAEAEQKILAFEEKYGMTFERLQEVGLPSDADWPAHEEFIEWSSWESHRKELCQMLTTLQSLARNDYATPSS